MTLTQSRWEVVNGGSIFEGERGSERQSCIMPGIVVLPNGRWICGFRAAPSKGGMTGQHVLLTVSDDEGRSWQPPFCPFVPPTIEGKPGLFRCVGLTSLGDNEVLAVLMWVDHSVPELPFFNEETEGLLDSRIFLARSSDGGATWSEPHLMDTTPFHVPVAMTGPILPLPNGDWVCQFELNKHYYDTTVWRHSSVVMLSSDQGQSWPLCSIASNDPANRFFYWDQRPNVLADGTLLDLFWTYDNEAATYLNIHARESLDNGRIWSVMWDTGVPGQPAPPVSLPDGRIAMVYVDRTAAPTIKIRSSEDGGRSWPLETEAVLYQTAMSSQTTAKGSMQDAWTEMGRFSVGLPTTTMVDGDVVIVFYAGPTTDCTGIHWIRLRP